MAKTITVYADQVEAGDELVLRMDDGSKRAFHVCAVYCDAKRVRVEYNTRYGFAQQDYDPNKRIRVRPPE
ncbi:MAG TPA: hypothetical protein VM715_03260 [Candidatus Acidoferrum sp.]|nr:hypothetical protein [Candidatus Acidoferrum sp.]